MNATERQTIKEFKKLLARKLHAHQIVLFGSRARGDSAPDSDMDILVLLDNPTEELEEYVSDCAWEAGFEHGIVIVPVVYSKQEWESGPDRFSLLALAIEKEGVRV
jgi:predicted nucleotidyltransferase